jgi:hypothetical protein
MLLVIRAGDRVQELGVAVDPAHILRRTVALANYTGGIKGLRSGEQLLLEYG